MEKDGYIAHLSPQLNVMLSSQPSSFNPKKKNKLEHLKGFLQYIDPSIGNTS